MPRRRKPIAKAPAAEDLSFPPPFKEQARYVQLANTFLSRNGDGLDHADSSAPDQTDETVTPTKSRKSA